MTTAPVRESAPLGKVTGNALRTPRAAAIAGIFFALLFIISMGLMRLAVPEDPSEDTFAWVQGSSNMIRFSLNLVPFVGIAFLWFLGVLRDRLGEYEDRFFSTVFFGSGLLFLAMVFVSAALGAGVLSISDTLGSDTLDSDAVSFGRVVIHTMMNVYAIRMAGVFMLSLSTIWLRTRILPRPIGVFTFLLANVMLFAINLSLWFVMIFPIWVLGISLYILVKSFGKHADAGLLNVAPAAVEAAAAGSASTTSGANTPT
jgi:hypothetical protein